MISFDYTELSVLVTYLGMFLELEYIHIFFFSAFSPAIVLCNALYICTACVCG